jgi:hypothetical protein
MNDPNDWQQSNDRQLAAALAALRQRLERFAQRPAAAAQAAPRKSPPVPAPQAPPPKTPTVSRFLIQRLLGESSRQPESGAAPPTGVPPSTEADAAPAAGESKPPGEPPSALAMLSQRLGLAPFEQDVLLLCAAMELDTRIGGLCARAQDDPQKPFPTFALALALFDDPSWDALSPERPLRYWRLIEINQPGAQPLTTSALRADERVVNYLKGLNHVDSWVLSFLSPLEQDAGPAELAPSQKDTAEEILRGWQRTAENAPLPVVQLLGPDPASKQLVAQDAAAKLNRRLYRLPVSLLPAAPADLETLARLWQRESRLLPLALYLDAEELDGTAERVAALSRFLARSDGVFFLGLREILPGLGRDSVALDVTKPTAAEQQGAWAAALGANAPDSPPELAAQFNLNLPNIQKLASLAHAEAEGAPVSLRETVWGVCRASERPRLDALAQRLEPKVTWDDLVLPKTEMDLLKQIAAQVRQRNTVYVDWGFARKMNRGFSISALFAGDSGTGKTMSAEVIANELRLNLYRIDLSAVVNKYIGETEKNLRRLFDAAEDGGAILFFDEADALFGKRSEVKDSHDRYANIEINYLLQRIESYRGLAILATNMKSALDTAFLRRLRFIVNLPFPGIADRRRLWEKVFLQDDVLRGLPAPPLAALDYDRLARLSLAPGDIHNTALNAAFLAAHAGTQVTMPLILEAARAEFLKRDRPINEADFRWSALPSAAPQPASRVAEASVA